MSKFNESVQIEETTLYQTGELMNEVNNTEEDFRLTAPAGENQDEDSLGELSTNEAIVIDDSRDLIDVDEPVDYCGAYGDYEDYEPSPYDGTYSEM